jgi:hypothetical protein
VTTSLPEIRARSLVVPTSRSHAEQLEQHEEEQDAPFTQVESSSRRGPKCAECTLREAQEKVEAPQTSVRMSKTPQRFSNYMTLMSELIEVEPSSFQEASEQQVWRDAMLEEYSFIMKNDVWEVVPQPEGKSVIGSRWIYKIKHCVDGSVDKFKARFVAKGFSHKEGIDFSKTFAPVARYSSIRVMISIAVELGWQIHQTNVKIVFLNGVIEEEIYIEQPEGFEVHSRASHVCRLRKALYGLKQAPHVWYSKIDSYLLGMGFTKSEANSNLYYILVGGEPLILVLYVDDLFLTGSEKLIVDCKRDLVVEFEMKDLGLMYYFLGLEVWQKDG